MGTPLSNLAQTKTSETKQCPQLVLEIEGVSTRYGLGSIKKYVKIGDPDLLIGDGWSVGGLNDQADQLDAISLDGTTTTIAQQLLQDQGGVNSVSGIQVALLDVDEELTRLITPGEVVSDILGRRANVYLGYQDTAFPQDFVQIFAGLIDEVSAGPTVIFNIAHPEQKKRGQIFTKVTTELSADIQFRSGVIQGLKFRTRRDVVGTVSIELVDGAAYQSEVITVVGNAIEIQFHTAADPGVDPTTKSRRLRDLLEKEIDVLSLVSIEVIDGDLDLVPQAATDLTSDTVLPVLDTRGFLLPMPDEGLLTYVRIDDEIIQYTGIAGNTLTGCTREALLSRDARAYGQPHDEGASVESFYRITGSAIDLALKMMMSGGPEYFAEDVPVKSINEVEGEGEILNALYFDGVNIENKYGIVPGDKVTVEDDAIPGNNVVDAVVAEVLANDYGSYLLLDGVTLTTQLVSSGVAKFKTKWNVWPEGAGLGMGGDEVDVPEFERIKTTYASSIFDYDFYLRDTVTVKDLIDQEILYPTGGFTLPRKGKISMGFTSPPIGALDLKKFDASNTVKPEQNRIYRGIARYFYNNIVFKYDENLLDDGKFLSGSVTVDADSKSRIPVGNRSLVIEARGLRPGAATDEIMSRLIQRFLDRYKFAAERISINAFYGEAFNIDVGDVVQFGAPELKLPDSKQGSRAFKARLYEVVNKSLNLLSGLVNLVLVDTAYSIEGARFGVVSPASLTDAGSTTAEIIIKNSFGHEPPLKERSKWTDYIGEKLLIHWGTDGTDWEFEYEFTLAGFKSTNPNAMLPETPLPQAPPANATIEVPHYPDTDEPSDNEVFKRIFVFTNPSVDVVTGVDEFSFNVDPADADLFKVGQPVILHKDDAFGLWEEVSPELKIASVTGTLIEVEGVAGGIGATPDSTWKIELIGFPDGGYPYRYL